MDEEYQLLGLGLTLYDLRDVIETSFFISVSDL